ncbi:hydroxymethylglutaryl-CoA lyase [Babesia caballi]|uniref:Hydroxymethylglutaryl-CoA lyase n=1 Tax=Babesia caballi TaxID=5871 RepID=A0AAV4LNW9_BABCB|nr:hydroxymethylglutaryl-CoA lyase [Babesia caballi]
MYRSNINTLPGIALRLPHLLQHPYREGYSRVAQPMRRNVGRSDAGASNKASGITFTFIPNELLKPLGQTGNKLTTIQSLPNLIDLCTKPGFRVLKFTKKGLDLLGDNNVIMSRQKGAHKSADAAEVKAVGATGQSSGARVACEGGGTGAGGLDVIEEISDVIVAKGVE